MKTNLNILVLFFFCQICLSQTGTRKLLHGQVMNDSIKVENVIVFNVNSKTGKVIRFDGSFEINARERDTLIFSSLSFKSLKLVLTEKQLEESPLIVKLDIFYNQLKEVVIDKNKSHLVSGNTQKIVDKQYFDDQQSSPKNDFVYDGTTNGVNFVRLYKDVIRVLKKKNPKKSDFTTEVNFTEVAMQRIKYSFYTNTLKLKDEEIKLFLVYCENDSKAKSVMKTKSDFELMDFMIEKNKEFKDLKHS